MSRDPKPRSSAPRNSRSAAAISLSIHAVALLAILGVLHGTRTLEPHQLPGTHSGLQLLTYYAPGSTHPAVNTVPPKIAAQQKPVPAAKLVPKAPTPTPPAPPDAQPGDATSGQSGLGDGNITIALQKYFPYPKPSLTSLPPGAAGDVVLKAIIDEHGKIAALTLLAGLGPAIDNDVIATVNQWVYTPAMKDGVPVASVEELHFHYQRRG